VKSYYLSVIVVLSLLFVVPTAYVNITRADEIEELERKLEYYKERKVLDLELKIIKAKIEELEAEYSDVIDTKTTVSESALSGAHETSEATQSATIEEASTEVASSTGSDHEWAAKNGRCGYFGSLVYGRSSQLFVSRRLCEGP
tara:strand:+ start:1249 stop:1680 length:432 start_codon:yes stop_codon:yes gene_type:complete